MDKESQWSWQKGIYWCKAKKEDNTQNLTLVIVHNPRNKHITPEYERYIKNQTDENMECTIHNTCSNRQSKKPKKITLCVQNDNFAKVGAKMQRPAFWNMFLS